MNGREVQKDLQNTALFRRAIHIIEQNGFRTNASFLEALGVGDLPTASEIIRQLQYEKVIVECKKKGYGKNGKPPHQITKTDPGRLRLAKKYFDPLYRVKSYYVLDKQGALTDKSPRTGQKTTFGGNKMSTPTPQTPKRKLDRSPQSILRSPKRIKNSSPEDFNPGFPAYSDDEL
ncbi:Dynactin subunit 6 [Neofusicoccum parvum]|nr:Dynactin subunit 6 [Neofusicoccum parvum]